MTFMKISYVFSILVTYFKKDFKKVKQMDTNLKLEEIDLEEKYGIQATLEPNEFLVKMNFLRVWFNN